MQTPELVQSYESHPVHKVVLERIQAEQVRRINSVRMNLKQSGKSVETGYEGGWADALQWVSTLTRLIQKDGTKKELAAQGE